MTIRLFYAVYAVDIALKLLNDEKGLRLSVDAENRLTLRSVLLG